MKAFYTKKYGRISLMDEDCNEFRRRRDKQFRGGGAEEALIEGVVKTTIKILYDKCLFDNYDKVDEKLKDNIINGVAERQRPSLNPMNDVIQ